MEFGEGLQHFEQSLLHAHAGLDTLDKKLSLFSHWYHGNMVP
jgi:hypothetical protein